MIVYPKAKINLCLRITGKRPDGYHDLDTVFQPVSLTDTLTAERRADEDFVFHCSDRTLETEDNLVCRAYRLLKDRYGFSGGLTVSLEKHIPSQAGLGGGSSDAAAMLKAADRLFDLGLRREQLIRLGAELGSDVPCFLYDCATRGSGTGTEVRPIAAKTELPLLILKPGAACSTPAMYRRLDELGIGGPSQTGDEVEAALVNNDIPRLFAHLRNDFDAAATAPEILACHRMLREGGAAATLLCGSGSAVCGVFTEPAVCERLRQKWEKEQTGGVKIFACHTVNKEFF